MDLGFTDGARIRPFLKTFAGDPRAYEVRGTLDRPATRSGRRTSWCGRWRESSRPQEPDIMSHNCESCVVLSELERMGVNLDRFDRVVALAGNPNTGKSTLFNALTGLKQHTGNWPGKTVTRAEGGFEFNKVRYKLVDLPGTYSLLSASTDEEVARDFLLFGRPDVTVVVMDATAIERNLNLVLQVLEITDRVVVAVNLMDEATRKGIEIDLRSLSRDLGVPADRRRGAHGRRACMRCSRPSTASLRGASPPSRCRSRARRNSSARSPNCVPLIDEAAPGVPNARWIAIRLLDGDAQVEEALTSGRLASLVAASRKPASDSARKSRCREPSNEQRRSRRPATRGRASPVAGGEFPRRDGAFRLRRGRAHRRSRLAHEPVERPDFDQRIDRIVTSPMLGLPIMALMLAAVFWLTIAGANVPSAMLADGFFWFEDHRGAAFDRMGVPWWITGFIWHGVYKGLAWVISVMLPPMAIFFPLFTILEDLGYLPARGVQSRLPVPARRRARQAGADHGDGVRLQRRRHHRHARHRLAAGAARRDPHQQLRALQRPASRR